MPPEALQVREFAHADAARWDAYVEASEDATFFHRAGWKRVLERAFRHRCPYLLAERGATLAGILPLGQINSRLFGNSLISLPFCAHAGVLADDDDARVALLARAEEIARELRVDYLELRNTAATPGDWVRKDLYVNFEREIDPDPEQNLLNIPRKQRAMVRKGIKAGLGSELDEGVDRLFAAYSESVRNLGTPVFPRRYFAILREEFGADAEVLSVTRDGQLVSSVLSFYFKDRVLPYYGGGTRDARQVKGNDFMYWELMRRAAERGLRVFDYGRSKRGTGSFDFKKNWGFEPRALHYEYRLLNVDALPDVSPMNPKYQLFINIWKRLPLGVTNVVGPRIARNLG